jgi:hypothetical protein
MSVIELGLTTTGNISSLNNPSCHPEALLSRQVSLGEVEVDV